MNCKKCGAEIEEGSIYCTKCGKAIQMVPDYNPWDEVLDETLKKAAGEEGNPAEEFDKTFAKEKGETKEQKGAKKMPKKRKGSRKRIAVYAAVLCLMLVGLVVLLVSYANGHSYSYQMKKAKQCFQAEDFKGAEKYYRNAIALDKNSIEARLGCVKSCFALGKSSEAQEAILEILKKEPYHEEASELLLNFYEVQGRTEDITAFLEECENKTLLRKYAGYISERPEFSLKEGTYHEEQLVELRAAGNSTIYYTLDGTEPTVKSLIYSEAISLKEGSVQLRAIAVSEKGVKSRIASAEYKIELEAPQAPDVRPNTGSYTEGAEITVSVPSGCRVYYTMDGSDPTSGSTRYEGPIVMKEGSFLFSAMAIGENGKHSDITRRNYSVQKREE